MNIKNKKINKNYPYQNLSLEDIKGEEWRDVEGFEGYYMVSNMGRVKSLARKIWINQLDRYFSVKEKVLQQTKTKVTDLGLRVMFSIRQENIRIVPIVARLVAKAFIFDDIDNKYILHNDKDINNNNVKNLYLADKDELIDYNYTFLDKKNASSKYKGVCISIRNKQVSIEMQFFHKGKKIQEVFKTELEAAKKYDYYIKKFNLKRKGNFN